MLYNIKTRDPRKIKNTLPGRMHASALGDHTDKPEEEETPEVVPAASIAHEISARPAPRPLDQQSATPGGTPMWNPDAQQPQGEQPGLYEIKPRAAAMQQQAEAMQPAPTTRTIDTRAPVMQPDAPPTGQLEEIWKMGAKDAPPAPATATPPAAAATEQKRAQTLDEQIAEMSEHLHKLQTEPVEDHNGRFKSFFANFLSSIGSQMQMAQERAARAGRAVSWDDLFQALAGGAGAGLAGVFNPKSDEYVARLYEIERTQGPLDKLILRQQRQAQIDATHARAEAARTKAADAPAKADAKQRTALMRELHQRMKLTGERFDPNDARSLELAQALNITPRGKGKGFNYQSIKTVGDSIVHIENIDGEPVPVVIYSAKMSEADKVRNAIALANVNASRSRNGEPPLEVDESALAPIPNQPAQSAQSAPAQPAPTSAPTAAPGAGGQPQQQQPPSPILREVPGAPKPPRLIGPYRHQGHRSDWRTKGTGHGQSSSGNASSSGSVYDNSAAQKIIDQIENDRGEYQRAMRRGQYDVADGVLQRMNARADAARSNPNLRGVVEVGGAQDHRGKNVPYVKFKPQREHASIDRQPEAAESTNLSSTHIKRSALLQYAQDAGLTIAQAEEEARRKGLQVVEDGQR